MLIVKEMYCNTKGGVPRCNFSCRMSRPCLAKHATRSLLLHEKGCYTAQRCSSCSSKRFDFQTIMHVHTGIKTKTLKTLFYTLQCSKALLQRLRKKEFDSTFSNLTIDTARFAIILTIARGFTCCNDSRLAASKIPACKTTLIILIAVTHWYSIS